MEPAKTNWRRWICRIFGHVWEDDMYYWGDDGFKVIVEFCYRCEDCRERKTTERQGAEA